MAEWVWSGVMRDEREPFQQTQLAEKGLSGSLSQPVVTVPFSVGIIAIFLWDKPSAICGHSSPQSVRL